MKNVIFNLIILILISVSVKAQIKLNSNIDSLVIKHDSIHFKFQNQLELNNPFGNENRSFVLPGSKQLKLNQNLAVIPNQRARIYADPNFKMPIFKPTFPSNMPVMKPDSSIHYHLRIQKIGK